MYKRPHHQKVARVLGAMNADFLRDTKCYFGGGTAIALLLGEYRESVDIDFLCSDQEGYRKLRESVFHNGLNELFTEKIGTMRDVRSDRDGVRSVLAVDGVPIKFEIIREARIDLDCTNMPNIPVPYLTKNDLFAEKLLANVDRFSDKSANVIDLMIMESHWGPIPNQAWEKAAGAYGDSVHTALQKAKELLRADPRYLGDCLTKMGINDDIGAKMRSVLGIGHDRSKSPSLGRNT